MANVATLLTAWPGPANGSPTDTDSALKYAVNILDQRTAGLNTSGAPLVPQVPNTYTFAAKPAAATYNGAFIIVSNATVANSVCYSNGTDWLVLATGIAVAAAA